jgi:glycosyltransferase involved in cell wall biosynthesis
VLSQTFQDFEIIIIDDGSTDNSKEIIEQYESNENTKIIYQKNKGLNITNNIALRASQGKYIMRLDADDFLDENALLVMTNAFISDPELGLVFPDYFLIDADGNILHVEKRNSFELEVKLLDKPAHGACTMIRKDFLMQLEGYDEEFTCQDGYELWVKFVAKYKVNNIGTPLFYYRQHGENLTTNEERILDTRKKIKNKFFHRNKFDFKRTMAIIPVRGSKYNAKDIAFKKLQGDATILDMKIRSALASEKIGLVVVSSPDDDIKKHVELYYKDNSKVIFHHRPIELARLNTGLVETTNTILKLADVQSFSPELLMILSPEYPLISTHTLEDAIHTLQIFESDSLISVRAEQDMFFQHDGSGMKPILGMEKFTKLEREMLYRYTGGVILTQTEKFIKNQELITGRVGHIEIDQKSTLRISSDFDLRVVELLLTQSVNS